MRVGDTIEERWQLLRLAGRGATGEVYLARDLRTNEEVAVKRLGRAEPRSLARFEREVQILARLAETDEDAAERGIVRYLAAGQSATGPFLVMEWLAGETLKDRLARGPLGLDATLALAREAAAALAVVHGANIVHRDLKPSNLFLRKAAPSSHATLAIIDFGIARGDSDETLTRAGDTLGTPAYMAPEQVRGHATDARSDVYALGAVLFECLTGRPLVTASDVMTALAQILVADTPSLTRIAPDCPPWLASLLGRMLSPDPAQRPADGAALVAQFDASAPGVTVDQGPLSRSEWSVVSVVLIGASATRGDTGDATVSLVARSFDGGSDGGDDIGALAATAARHGGQLDTLPNDPIVSFARTGTAADRAARAVRAAHELHAQSGRPVAVATGLGLVTGVTVLGEVVERARSELARAGDGVAIDLATSQLVATRVGGELGRGPFVGRRGQLSSLVTMLAEVIDERVSRCVLVSGDAGAGKSRLVRHFARGDDTRDTGRPVRSETVWSARADATRSAVPLAFASELVAAALAFSDPRDVDPALLDLVGRPPEPSAASASEPKAPIDPSAAATRRESAIKSLFARAAQQRPLIVVLDDMQWADRSSLQLLRRLLAPSDQSDAAGGPILWVLTVRSEAAEWVAAELGGRMSLQLHLPPLSTTACEELVRALMPEAPAELVTSIAQKGAGHPLFLEELARAALSEPSARTPDTVRMMLQARLEHLHPTARHVLRAASVFGRDFWVEGVAFIAHLAPEIVRAHLDALVRDDLVRVHGSSRYDGTGEAAFRHDLVREAAYAMSTGGDRQRGHRLAAAWLVGRERRAATIAMHLAAGDRPDEAAIQWAAATMQAYHAGDPEGLYRCAAEARAIGVSGMALAQVEASEGWAMLVSGDVGGAADLAGLAVSHADPESDTWYAAAATVGSTAAYTGRLDLAREVAGALAARWVAGQVPSLRLVIASARMVSSLISCGSRHLGLELVKRFVALDPELVRTSDIGIWLDQTRAFIASDAGDHAAAARSFLSAAERLYANGEMLSVAQRGNAADELLKVGAWQAAEAVACGVDRATLPGRLALALDPYAGLAAAYQGRLEEGIALIERYLGAWEIDFIRGQVLSRLVPLVQATGDLARALELADDAVNCLGSHPLHLPSALATRSRVRRALGDLAGAREDAEGAWARLLERGQQVRRTAIVRLALIDEVMASGDLARARMLTRDAVEALLAAAARVSDAALRESFLHAIPEHAETLARA